MKARILSPKGIEFDGDIKSFNVKTRSGEITVLDHHHPIMTILERGVARVVTTSGEQKTMLINSGFLEVDSHNTLSALINQ